MLEIYNKNRSIEIRGMVSALYAASQIYDNEDEWAYHYPDTEAGILSLRIFKEVLRDYGNSGSIYRK